MITRRIIITLMFTLSLVSSAWAQSAQYTVQDCRAIVPQLLQMIQMKGEMTSQWYGVAQRVGNYPEMQLLQQELQMHQGMYNGVSDLARNPQRLDDPNVRQKFQAGVEEYLYRSDARDMRPYDQIKSLVAKHAAYARWKATTPEGQAAHRAEMQQIDANTAQNTANHNARMNTMNAQSQAHNARMNALNAQSQAHNNAWNEQQRIGDVRQQQNVHGIYNEYQYVDPNTNQTYWVPMENTNPAVMNPDGTTTELQPYHNY